jgi:mycoredoxin
MNKQHLKSFFLYALILAAGLGVGMGAPRLLQVLKPAYTEGNNSAYFPDAQTQVVLYGTPTCPHCANARAYLRAHHIAYADFDVQGNEKAMRDFTQLGGTGVPLLLVGERRMTGFNPAVLEAALKHIGRME